MIVFVLPADLLKILLNVIGLISLIALFNSLKVDL
jgi:hypothetical protein